MPVPANWAQDLRDFVEQWKAKDRQAADPLWARDHRDASEGYLGDRPFGKFVLTEVAGSWEDFLRWVGELQGSWGFRGQREAEWSLETSLDRATKREGPCGYDHLGRETEGAELLFRFRQQAHLYLKHPPTDDDLSSWFAIMQHHGAPTPLLDWTYSPYVAAYFAVEDEPQRKEVQFVRGPERGHASAVEEEPQSAVWSIDLDWLEAKVQGLLLSEASVCLPTAPIARAESLNGLLRRMVRVVVRIDPLRIDERTVAQQGFFLCSRLPEGASFNQALMRMMMKPETPGRPVLRKLVVGKHLRVEFLRNLREMNIHRASLFPGLDGFGQSLRLDMEIRVKQAEA